MQREHTHGIHLGLNKPFSILRIYEEAEPTAVYTPKGKLSVNKLYNFCDGLVHIDENVRVKFDRMRLYEDYLYLHESGLASYGGYEYKRVKLSEEEVVEVLKKVFYCTQPKLQSHSLVGSSSKNIEDDPNYYQGSYVLNNDEEYSILKCKDEIRFYKGIKSYYPDWKNEEDLIFKSKIDFEVYKISLELNNLKNNILKNPDKSLKDGMEIFKNYFEKESQLKETATSKKLLA